MKLEEKLVYLRKEKRLSQMKLAEMMNVWHEYYWKKTCGFLWLLGYRYWSCKKDTADIKSITVGTGGSTGGNFF